MRSKGNGREKHERLETPEEVPEVRDYIHEVTAFDGAAASPGEVMDKAEALKEQAAAHAVAK